MYARVRNTSAPWQIFSFSGDTCSLNPMRSRAPENIANIDDMVSSVSHRGKMQTS